MHRPMRARAASLGLLLSACSGASPADPPRPAPGPRGAPPALTSSVAAPAPAATSLEPGALAAPEGEALSAPPTAPRPAKLIAEGQIGWRPFNPKVASIHYVTPEGFAVVSLRETDRACELAANGERALLIEVPWKDGASVDLSTKREVDVQGKRSEAPVAELVRTHIGQKKQQNIPTREFNPSGKATLVSAPRKKGATGRLEIDLTSAKYRLHGDVDVVVCADVG